MQISHLPPEIVSHILSFLPWKEKVRVCNFIPSWKPYLHSTHAWTWTHFDMRYCWRESTEVNGFYKCLEDYGTYIQTCWAQGVMDKDLQMFYTHCPNLKSIDISLTHNWFLESNDDLTSLVLMLSVIVRETKVKKLALCGITYAVEEEYSIEMLLAALREANLHTKLHKLEFSHFRDFSGILPSLQLFDQLVVLKCPIEVLTTATIDALANSSLQTLHVVNSSMTLKEDFIEKECIDWSFLGSAHPELQVHYIVDRRPLDSSDLCPNPLIRGFILDTISMQLPGDVILAIADHYGKTLQSFVYSTIVYLTRLFPDMVPKDAEGNLDWGAISYDYDETAHIFETFVHKCPHLLTFVCGWASWVSERMLRVYGSQFRELLVCAHLIEFNHDPNETFDRPTSLASLEEAVSTAMGRPWNALTVDRFMEKLANLLELWDLRPCSFLLISHHTRMLLDGISYTVLRKCQMLFVFKVLRVRFGVKIWSYLFWTSLKILWNDRLKLGRSLTIAKLLSREYELVLVCGYLYQEPGQSCHWGCSTPSFTGGCHRGGNLSIILLPLFNSLRLSDAYVSVN